MFALRQKPHFRAMIYFWGLTVIGIMLVVISVNTPTQLEAIKQKGVLRVATRNTPMTYYIDKGRPAGFEYELARAFADHLGVRMELILPPTFADLFTTMRERNAHIAASNLSVTEQREKQFDFGPPYRKSAPTIIYRVRQGQPQPQSIADLYGKKILVLEDSSQAELLSRLKLEYPELEWDTSEDDAATELLNKVHDETIDFTIMDSTVFDAQKSFYPGLAKGFALEAPQPIAWMLPKHYDGSLKQAINEFFALPETQKLIDRLEARYFSRQNQLNFFDTSEFRRALDERYLPLEQYFMLAEQETGIDHLLLAAIAYQESHWKADAVSPTGVKGIMMLTNGAAEEVGVTDRTDPHQSILGGAEYLISVRAKIPDRIPEPDHTWFALAGYNIGFGHLEDARILTQRAGKNPDNWQHVREHLPLLANEKYYSTLRYGYARGYEPVTYVANIRKYMEVLRWAEQVSQASRSHGAASGEAPPVDSIPPQERSEEAVSPTL
ncbi:membrane-bound lytic murein transglycosylase MltF [Marinobacterium lutimaris]|uniref:Membrane-bound lytic murein transglycosylase F n=1 Tax=Marinobacterium lutimaris TaxID=568106 RepID=A0A1H6CFT3_9GAMM|nr:membrane-bound lytic murein transglycosylase MltF [Marinobacterium lutimaris]SEG71515.1 membrane-bound lytic murein transglycosylase F [Marinobacterium lutimaris]